MATLWFSSPVPVWINPKICKLVAHVEDAAEVLFYSWPRDATTDPGYRTAIKACYNALAGIDDAETARAIFEAAAQAVGLLG